jgi:hypothetical protein
VTWDEVERAFKKKDADLLVFEAKQVVARFDKMGDLFAPVLELKQRLPDLKGVASATVTEGKTPISIAAQAEDEPEEVRPRLARKTGKTARARKPRRKV